jgi:molybdenum cofactor cytidylyltransferase
MPAGEYISVVLLAAGRASRMGDKGCHKLLAEFGGVPLVRRSACAALESKPAELVVVTGHRSREIENALSGLPIRLVRNPDYELGIASSLNSGLAALAPSAAGMLVMLADMPKLTCAHLNALIERFEQEEGNSVIRSVSRAQPGSPVIIPRRLFSAVMTLTGDMGAKHLLQLPGIGVVDIDIGDAAHTDVDTPEAVILHGGKLTA